MRKLGAIGVLGLVCLAAFVAWAAPSREKKSLNPEDSMVDELPACTEDNDGLRFRALDALSPSPGNPVVAGGDQTPIVECDGTSWLVDTVGGGAAVQSGQLNYARAGCASASATTTGGCNGEGLWLIRTDHHWANSPGVRHSTTGASFATGPIAGAGDSPWHDSEEFTIGENFSFASCDGLSQFCASMVNAFDGTLADNTDAVVDPHFCRSNVSPYGACSTGADCVSSIAGADDPEAFVIQHATYNDDFSEILGYTYSPAFVTAYSGCNSTTNTVTMQPIKAGGLFPSKFSVQAGDKMQAAYNDGVHPAPFYGGYLAQEVMLARVGGHFEPRVNLVGANGYGDDETACDDVGDSTGASNSATAATNAVAHDPTKASYLGSWSSVSGGACVYTGAESDVVQLKTFAVTPGAYYNVRVRAGVSNENSLSLRIRDNANANVNARWISTLRGDNTIPPQSSAVSINARATSGWNTFTAKVQAPEGATTLRLEINYGGTTGNHYWDDYVVWPAIDPGADDSYVLPHGPHRALLVSDSRGATADLADKLREAATFLRPDIDLTLDEDSFYGRSLDTLCASGSPFCWNWVQGSGGEPSRAQQLAGQGYDTAIVFLGVNDFTLISGGVRPAYLMARIMEAVSSFQAAGMRVLWIQEPPVLGNSTFSGTASVCRDSNGSTALGCGRYVERVFRLLTRGGFVN